MGFYTERILPYFLDWSLSSPLLAKYRRAALAGVQGEVLEIGFGTGINLPYYPASVRRIVTVDVHPGLHKLAQQRMERSSITVEHQMLSGEDLPMPDESFDSVVSTFTLCSISDVESALREIYRVLKSGGRYFFLEHGLSNEPRIQLWQHRLTPLQKVMVGGCHLDRNIGQLVAQQFDDVQLNEGYAEGLPRLAGYLYCGAASKTRWVTSIVPG
jgi:ubiquinone/menaquinone biosynthesis C-methylase UbiE